MNDALVPRAVEDDRRRRIASLVREQVLRAAEIAGAFLTGRANEIDGTLGRPMSRRRAR